MMTLSSGSIKAAAVFLFLSVVTPTSVYSNGAADGGPGDILLITLDTTRADRLGCYGYAAAATPRLDALAREGVRFANAYAPAPLTLPSHCSIMTGADPLAHQVHNNGIETLGPDIPTLATILRSRGYRTAAFVASFTLDSRFGLARGFDLYDDRFLEDEILKNFRSERSADKVFASFSSWLEATGNEKTPFFCWAHFYDPHLPYDPPSPFREKFAGRKYDGEIAFVDQIIGNILDKLREKKRLDGILIIVAGDHGEALGEKKEIDHGFFLYEGTLRVPLIFYSPGGLPAGVVASPRVRLIDILPTILDLRNIPPPAGIQGASLRPAFQGRNMDDRPVVLETFYPRNNFGWSELRGLIDGPWKLILAPRPELFDVKNDPSEERDLFQIEAPVSREMIAAYERIAKERSRKADRPSRTLTAEEEERLRSLGYVGIRGAEASPRGGLPDPKDKIEDYLLYYHGNLLETEGQFEKAAECYGEVLRRNPDSPSHYINLGFLFMKMDRTSEAIALMEHARGKFPDSIAVLSRLMTYYLKAERWEDATAAGEAVLAVEPGHFDALFLLGSAYAKKGNWAEALKRYQAALEIEPENKTLRHRRAFALAALGRKAEALDAYRQLKILYPEEAAYDLDVSRVYEAAGERTKALAVLKEAVARRSSPELFYAYAMMLEKTGDLGEAVRQLKRYLETTPEGETSRKTSARRDLALWEKRLKRSA